MVFLFAAAAPIFFLACGCPGADALAQASPAHARRPPTPSRSCRPSLPAAPPADDAARRAFVRLASVASAAVVLAPPSGWNVPRARAEEDGASSSGAARPGEASAATTSVGAPAGMDAASLYDEEGRVLSEVEVEVATVPVSVDFADAGAYVSYSLPSKWRMPGYVDVDLEGDGQKGVSACDSITVTMRNFEGSDTAALVKRLDSAAKTGVNVALGLEGKAYQKADVVGGKKRGGTAIVAKTKAKKGRKVAGSAERTAGGEPTYYDFDLAIAPETCVGGEKDPNNLGMGFCPYESIALLSAVAVNDKLFVLEITCRKDQWKRSNSDLKQIRTSFRVDAATTESTA